MDKRRKGVEFRIKGVIPGVKKTDVKDGILLTYNSAQIAKLRSLDDTVAEEVFRERA